MNDQPKKTLSITRKPAPAPSGTVTRTGKRIIRRESGQAPGKGKSVTGTGSKPGRPGKKPARRPQPQKPVISPSGLRAKALNERLNAFPVWREFRPLCIGVDHEIYRLVNDERFAGGSKKVVQKVLKLHTLSGRYQQVLQQGGPRFSLDGVQAGEVNAQQREMAGVMLQRREPGRA